MRMRMLASELNLTISQWFIKSIGDWQVHVARKFLWITLTTTTTNEEIVDQTSLPIPPDGESNKYSAFYLNVAILANQTLLSSHTTSIVRWWLFSVFTGIVLRIRKVFCFEFPYHPHRSLSFVLHDCLGIWQATWSWSISKIKFSVNVGIVKIAKQNLFVWW